MNSIWKLYDFGENLILSSETSNQYSSEKFSWKWSNWSRKNDIQYKTIFSVFLSLKKNEALFQWTIERFTKIRNSDIKITNYINECGKKIWKTEKIYEHDMKLSCKIRTA